MSKWLFPEIEADDRENRSALARQAAQRVRKEKRKAAEYLRARDLEWLIDKLVDKGPATEVRLMDAVMTGDTERNLREVGELLVDLWSLWRVGKLWRVSQGIHPGAGEVSYLYGIRGVHPQPGKQSPDDGQ